MHYIKKSQIERRKTQLVKVWLSLGLDREALYDIYHEEVKYYNELTWVMMYGWFMGEPVAYIHSDAYLNELCSYRRGKILLQLAGGYFYKQKNGKNDTYEILPRTFNYVFIEQSLFIYLLQRTLINVKRIYTWVQRKPKRTTSTLVC